MAKSIFVQRVLKKARQHLTGKRLYFVKWALVYIGSNLFVNILEVWNFRNNSLLSSCQK